jgi:hypothetical protein
MLIWLRRTYADFITSGAQLLLLFAGVQFYSRNAWLVCLALIAVISVFAWMSSLKRLRAFCDTPVSKIASAAQGWVKLSGNGEQFGDQPVFSQLKRLPCLWYRYKLEVRDVEGKWRIQDSGESFDSFVLRDSSGSCIVDPEQAEIFTRDKDSWTIDNYRYTEWRLHRRDTIYVIGEFRTKSCALEFNRSEEVKALLAKWKLDMPALLKRFDLNGDGVLDMTEWELARHAAQREVAKIQQEDQAIPDIQIIGKPRDDSLFLISNLTPEKISRRYLIWSWLHLLIFLGALCGMGWVVQTF